MFAVSVDNFRIRHTARLISPWFGPSISDDCRLNFNAVVADFGKVKGRVVGRVIAAGGNSSTAWMIDDNSAFYFGNYHRNWFVSF
jgi:hypothetical protein